MNRRLPLTAIGLTVLLAINGCGGGGGSTTELPVELAPPPVEKATVTVLLTDAPSDHFDEINVTISSIQLLGGSDPQTLFEGSETVDLLQLENFSDLFVVADDIDAGTYDKIRLRISDLELVGLDEDGNVVESIHPSLPANGKIDLNPRGSFEVAGGDHLMLQLDMDARRSIHMTGNGRYRFRPVVFVDVLSDRFDGKNVRINGEITAIDEANSTMEVCQQRPSSSSDDNALMDGRTAHCVTVVIDDETGIFDSDGNAAAFVDLQVGDQVTVIGRFAMDDEFGDDGRLFVADVVTIGPPGTFERLEGTVLSAVDADNRFDFLIAPGQGFADGSTISVELQPGTHVVDDDGEPVGADQIQPDIIALVEGVVALSGDSTDTLRAAYVVLDLMSEDGMGDDDEIMLSGEVLTVDVANAGLTLSTDDGDRCVRLDDDTGIFEITVGDETSLTNSIELGDVIAGSPADVYGTEDIDGCIDASVIIVSPPA
ncbi:MAG: DUF4382 domain-containing protein [Gammaproteobacteria bacterium]|nr:DUF4382 domain-containing protein [Gammaproteobacteria bacterium]MDH3767501.1 DUF4382 domain-containing protein [Gammaproteobacteria bacterium]